jgi:hypothetical protein
MQIRRAEQHDLADIIRLLSLKRRRLASFEPLMWRVAPDAEKVSEAFLGYLLQQPTTLAFTAHKDGAMYGCVVAQLQASPPVYAPGGLTCLIDDLAVEDGDLGAQAATALLHHTWGEAKLRGAVQTLVVAAEKDAHIAGALRQADLHPASVWWTKAL